MDGKINFILGVHDHLPNGSGEDEFETLYNYKIRPLVSSLYQFPRINVVFHYSGVLFHWIERRHPELFVLIEDLLSRKQVELLGGGFYEPMMPLLPPSDRIGQIEMLTTYLRRQFGRRPQGCRLPAMSWEQNLVSPLIACGMDYTFLDESYFASAGAMQKAKAFYEPCITEDQGKIITVFPVSSSLESIGPAGMLERLGTLASNKNPDDGPVTVFPVFTFNPGDRAETEYQHFFEELSGADSAIEFTTPGRIFKNLHSLKKLYFTGNPVAERTEYVSSPRQFLTDYPEAGDIYAKMIHTRVLINQLRGDKARKQTALDELWKAQDSTLYRLEGLANTPVRKAAYRALLEADKITRGNGSFSSSLSVFDYDLDGEDEYVFQDEKLNCYIKGRGAFLFELDYLPIDWNFLDSFSVNLSSGKNSAERNRRSAFSEYLVQGEKIPDLSWKGIPGARFCGNEMFEVIKLDRVHKQVQFKLAPVPAPAKMLGNIHLIKTWFIKRNVLSLQYDLKNTGTNTEKFFLVPSIDLSFSGADEFSVKLSAMRGSARENLKPEAAEQSTDNITGIEFRDINNEAVLILEASRQFKAKIFRVTVQETGEYQFNSIMPIIPLTLDPGKSWDITFSIKISS